MNNGQPELSDKQVLVIKDFKFKIAIIMTIVFLALWFNPIKGMIHRRLRFATLITLYNVIIAPFGNVEFKTYLLAEILTDCPIVIADTGKVALYFSSDGWNDHATKLSDDYFAQILSVKWIFYLLTFLPYMWRMN